MPDRLVAQFHVSYIFIEGREHVAIQSHKYRELGWYLTVNKKGKFHGAVPANDSEMFEVITLEGPNVTLRSVYYPIATPQVEPEISSGSGESRIGPSCGNNSVPVSCNGSSCGNNSAHCIFVQLCVCTC